MSQSTGWADKGRGRGATPRPRPPRTSPSTPGCDSLSVRLTGIGAEAASAESLRKAIELSSQLSCSTRIAA
eukprot:5710398-Alexandrium_andersonii.AAC.1